MKKTIFILEDNDELRELYGYILEGENYEIRTFATVTQFMENARQIPHLYLLDVMLPDGDGIELCIELKRNSLTANVPVIMISAHKNLADIKSECPQADFIAKPFDIEELTKRIALKINA
ncbi:response regulator transcription factor [Pedobacter polaris]|uniref:Response regulator transcription factor n=1 Tax=Pedobacter polaris TaxID=2571273 RepID=A0A4U1CTU5_9SPHI|nr:response regulator [Pedobacter polaris]TKC10530.1 response regulator transcription factor [Pedobacter polaris]